ncbi:hypothetical protein B0H10DRAFT_2046270 [Mycena sp. CBHHK59/15]|nr:hypothetical protein B0H10DRAFT_2046270 [Mycena sp. CBHHK59/15]
MGHVRLLPLILNLYLFLLLPGHAFCGRSRPPACLPRFQAAWFPWASYQAATDYTGDTHHHTSSGRPYHYSGRPHDRQRPTSAETAAGTDADTGDAGGSATSTASSSQSTPDASQSSLPAASASDSGAFSTKTRSVSTALSSSSADVATNSLANLPVSPNASNAGDPSPPSTPSSKSSTPIIAGVLVPVLVLLLATAALVLHRRRRRARDRREWERTHASIADAVRQVGGPATLSGSGSASPWSRRDAAPRGAMEYDPAKAASADPFFAPGEYAGASSAAATMQSHAQQDAYARSLYQSSDYAHGSGVATYHSHSPLDWQQHEPLRADSRAHSTDSHVHEPYGELVAM